MSKFKTAQAGQYLTFTLFDRTYGVPIADVREINRATDITPVPQTAGHVSGVVNLRGKVIPIVDLRVMLGLGVKAFTKETCSIVVDVGESQIGLIVDAVNSVLTLQTENLEAPPKLSKSLEGSCIIGMGKVDDKVIILLNVAEALEEGSINANDAEMIKAIA